MPTRRTVILVAAFLAAAFGAASAPLALSLGATAADASALAFVTDIYSAYKGKDAKGHPLDDERAIRRYFEPSLAALMVKDQKIAAKRGEVGLLDFDPFIDAQDWEISNFDITVDDVTPGDQATVYLLDPNTGYQLTRPGTSGVTCLVERTAWEQADFRNDIYVPLCYDAEGTKTYLKVIMDVAALRIQKMSPVALKAEIENRYKNKTYKTPEKPGLSYMAAPIMRTWMNPDWTVHIMPVPHLMFYAPNLTNEDIGAVPNADHSFPFIFKEGIAEQSYIIHLVGEAEKTKVIADEKALLDDLCAYREFLCLPSKKH